MKNTLQKIKKWGKMFFWSLSLPVLVVNFSLCSPFSPRYVSLRVMLADTYLDRAKTPLSVSMRVKLSPPTDQRHLAHYLCVAERRSIQLKSGTKAWLPLIRKVTTSSWVNSTSEMQRFVLQFAGNNVSQSQNIKDYVHIQYCSAGNLHLWE